MPVSVLRPGRRLPEPGERESTAGPAASGRTLRCALVNNMPDAALARTERQFLDLLGAGAGDTDVPVRRYAFAEVPRGARSTSYLAVEYFPVEELWDDEPHAVIVTGSEPLAPALADEPYWGSFVALLDSALARPTAVLLSCLSAHAALLTLDGIDRVPLRAKCSGVFAHDVLPGTALGDRMGPTVPMPHSRRNGIPTEAVRAAGWDVLLSSPVGWGALAGRRDRADLLLVQGHPEYDPTTLVREWRRDLGRWLEAGRPDVPVPPTGAVDPGDEADVWDLYRGLCAGGDAAAIDGFGFDAIGARAPATWRPAAETLYANWIEGIVPSLPARGRTARAGD